MDFNDPQLKVAVAYAAAGHARDTVRRMLRDNPEITPQQILDELEGDFQVKLAAAHAQVNAPDEECAHCGRPIRRASHDRRLHHVTPDTKIGPLGCRSASWDWWRVERPDLKADEAWDNSLLESWQAKRKDS